jgi:hypothetical protein
MHIETLTQKKNPEKIKDKKETILEIFTVKG